MSKVPKGMTLVVGLGVSGRAICRHLTRHDVPFMVADTGANPVEGMPNVNFDNTDPLFGPLPSPGPGMPEPPTLLQVMLGDVPEVTHE